MTTRPHRLLLGIFIGLLIGYACALTGLYVAQRVLLYAPVAEMRNPQDYDLNDFKQVSFTAEDGTVLVAWTHPADNGKPLIVFFHGNGGNLSYHAEKLRQWALQGFGVLGLSYRGYGGSAGKPSEKGLYLDARAAMRYAGEVMKQPVAKTIVYGESLGTGVAVQMATEYPIGALVLEAPYRSVADRAQELYPYFPVLLLIKDHFDSMAKIGKVHAPLLVLHGEVDTIIPISHGRAIYAAANAPKEAEFYPGVGHVDFDAKKLALRVKEFAGRYVK